MKKLTNIILTIATILSICAVYTVATTNRNKRMNQYAVEHNCRWDYNDMCYTQEQKPWLFK